jgi:hypothetical protein
VTLSQTLDVVTFGGMAFFCVYDFWKFRDAPSEVARPIRFKAAGILLFATLFLQRAFLRTSSAGLQIVLVIAALVGGGLLFFLGSRKK